MARKIFISYRREDAGANVLGISQYLEHQFGPKNVFIDVDMRAGAYFPTVLKQRLAKSKVMLVLIGPEWINAAHQDGGRRLDKPDDWVRLEIAQALKRNMPIIPVRVGNTFLPNREHLPSDIRGLLDHQAVSVTLAGFRHEMASLTRDIRAIPNTRSWLFLGAIAAAALLALGIIGSWLVAPQFREKITELETDLTTLVGR
jgi:TIR domain